MWGITLDTVIEEVTYFKYLGVYLDNPFNWDIHVREVIAKCSSLCGILKKLSKSDPHHVLLKVYLAYIHSRYRYAIAVWGSCPKIYLKELQVQQNRCIKAVYKLPFLHLTCYRCDILPYSSTRETTDREREQRP